jgi:hypothetical protein
MVFGLDPAWGMLTVPFIGFLAGFGWGSCGIMIAGIVKSIDGFSYVSAALLTPLFLVAGTFFPLTSLPHWAQVLGNFNPLFHCVQLVRHASFGWQGWADVGHLAVIVGFGSRDVAPGHRLPAAPADRLVQVNGVDLCVETFGSPTDPAILLIMGAAPRWIGGRTTLRPPRGRAALRRPLRPPRHRPVDQLPAGGAGVHGRRPRGRRRGPARRPRRAPGPRRRAVGGRRARPGARRSTTPSAWRP